MNRMIMAAVFSDCRNYRYSLSRAWGEDADPKALLVVGLNPSTADQFKDDPTIRRCIGFARSWGFGAIWMANLFAFRSTNPRALYSIADPVGPENDAWLSKLSSNAGLTLVAWGNHGTLNGRNDAVLRLLEAPHCLGTTKHGHPRHPLYVKSETKPEPYRGEFI